MHCFSYVNIAGDFQCQHNSAFINTFFEKFNSNLLQTGICKKHIARIRGYQPMKALTYLTFQIHTGIHQGLRFITLISQAADQRELSDFETGKHTFI
jgi:hypothetical protein